MDAKQLTGIRLRLLRTERGLTMPDLCDDIERIYGKKIHKGMYSKWENGIHDPAIEFVRILSQYYDESMKPCDNRRVRENDLNQIIKDSILSLKFKDLKPKKREKTVNNDRELAKIDRQIAKLIDLYAIESMPINELKKRINELEKKKALLTVPEATRNDFKVQKDILSRAREAFDSDEVTLARMVVDSLVEMVTVRKDVIEVKWTFL